MRGKESEGRRSGGTGAARRRRPNGAPVVRPVQGRAGYWRADQTVRGREFSATGRSPEQASERLREKIAASGRRPAGAADPSQIRVRDYVAEWLERRRLEIGRGLSEESWQRDERALSLHVLPAVGDLRVSELTAADLEALYARLLRPPSCLSVDYVRRINATFGRALGRVTRDFGLLNATRDVELPRRERVSEQRPLTAEQMARFWLAARDDRLVVLWLLASVVPSRSGELRALKWGDWDEARGELVWRRSLKRGEDGGRRLVVSEGKSEANARVLELDPVLTAALRWQRERQSAERAAAGRAWVAHDLVFPTRNGTPIARANLLRAFRVVLRRAGLPRHYRVHDLRHTAVTAGLRAGVSLVEISGAAGHASPAVTAKLYAHSVRRVRPEVLGRVAAYQGAAGVTLPALGSPGGSPGGSRADEGADEDEDEGTPVVPVVLAPAPPASVGGPPILPPDGQPRALTPAEVEEARRLYFSGWTQAQLAVRYGHSASTINRAIRGVTGRRPGQAREASEARGVVATHG